MTLKTIRNLSGQTQHEAEIEWWLSYVKEKYSGLKRIVPKNTVFNYIGENPDEA